MKKIKSADWMLCIDPAAHGSGLSLWRQIEPDWQAWKMVASCGTKKGVDQIEAIEIIERLLEGRDISQEDCYLVIETWMVQRSRSAVESLAASQRMWISAAERVFMGRVRVFKVNSQTWMSRTGVLKQKKLLGSTKGVTAALAASIIPGKQFTEDEADSIVMGNWWLQAGSVVGHESRAAEGKERRAKERGKKEAKLNAASDIEHYRKMGCLL